MLCVYWGVVCVWCACEGVGGETSHDQMPGTRRCSCCSRL